MKICKNCGTTERTKRGGCRRCANLRTEKWRKENPEKSKASTLRWRTNNHDKFLALLVRWRKENPEKQKLASKRWDSLHREKRTEDGRRWRKENPDAIKALRKKWVEKNPEKMRLIKRRKEINRRARKKYNGGTLSKGIAEKLFQLQQGKCIYCKTSLYDGYHLDHRMPLALGGPHEDSNMQLLCPTCNINKNAKHPVAFAQEIGLLL